MRKNRIKIDLNYKHIKAITILQTLYKQRKSNVSLLNKKMGLIYSTLVSVMNNISTHYVNDVITQEDYTKLMLKIDDVLQCYEKLPSPVTLEIYRSENYENINLTINYIEYQVIELVKNCGASSCYDILKIMVGTNWMVGIRHNYSKLMKFYNTTFVPRSVRITSLSESQDPPTLPDVKRYSSYTESVLLHLHGAELYIPIYNKLFVLKGYFRHDPLNIARIGGTLGDKREQLLLKLEKLSSITESYKIRYVDQISLRDFLSLDILQLTRMVEDSYAELKKLLDQPLSYVTEQFSKSKLESKSKLLTLLLLDDEQRYANSLIGSLSSDESKALTGVYKYLHWTVQRTFDEITNNMDSAGADLNVGTEELPYDIRIENLKASKVIKDKAKAKLKEIRNSRDGNDKATKYLDGLLSIPFGVYKREKMLRFLGDFKDELTKLLDSLIEYQEAEPDNDFSELINKIKVELDDIQKEIQESNPKCTDKIKTTSHIRRIIGVIHGHNELLKQLQECYDSEDTEYRFSTQLLSFETRWETYKSERHQYMNNVQDKLDCIHGQQTAKRKVETLIAQWINGEMEGAVFGFQGPPGTGKTSLAKEGLSNCLVDEDGSARPFSFIALGGSTNGSTLGGHGYTYVGSQWGSIVGSLMETKCMNPIIYFDELDKVSATPHGREIISILTHLTDPEQNALFKDKYFDGVNLDLSKALIVFSYNDPGCIDDPALRSRIHEVEFKGLVRAEKIHIAQHYMLPKILNSVGYTGTEMIFTEQAIVHIVDSYVYEAGVRDLKEKLYVIVRELNARHLQNEAEYPLPISITSELVDDILERKNRILIESIPKKPQVGWVNGLYATLSGIGGLTIIQVYETIAEQKFSLEITGSLGDVMKESIKCAKTISWKVLPREDKLALQEEWKINPYGLHIHCPSAGTKKEGPSAGAAITTAVVSFLTKLPIRNYIAMTGEIDLNGRILPIGGLQAKVEGAIRAGVKIVLIPHKRNGEEWDDLAADYEGKITVVKVTHISQVFKFCLLNPDNKELNSNLDPKDPIIEQYWPLIEKYDREPHGSPEVSTPSNESKD